MKLYDLLIIILESSFLLRSWIECDEVFQLDQDRGMCAKLCHLTLYNREPRHFGNIRR